MVQSESGAPDQPETPQQTILSLAFALFSAAMIALAAGAVWMLLGMIVPGALIRVWLALPVGAGLGWIMRHWVAHRTAEGVVLAALTTLLAIGYMRALLSAGMLAGTFDLSFGQSLQRAGTGTLVDLAWLSMSPFDLWIYLFAALLAAFVAWRTRTP